MAKLLSGILPILLRSHGLRYASGLRIAGLLCALGASSLAADGLETGFWAWDREAVLSPLQQAQLRGLGTRALIWYAGSLDSEGGRWVPEDCLRLPARPLEEIACIPVLRLVPGKENPLSPEAALDLAARICALRQEKSFAEAQIDFDCPDRLLPQYAAFLRISREAVRPLRLSATALAGWSASAAFPKLQESVDALFPMFYDLQPDLPTEVRAGRILPALDPANTARQIASWSACRIPWHAGLPGFARVTIFDALGKSRGHLRHWSWDAIAFDPALQTIGQPSAGVTLLRAQRDCIIADTPVTGGETVACRWPRAEDLRQALIEVKAAGATGVAIFRLPEGGAPGGWSLAQWGSLFRNEENGSPRLRLIRSADGIELRNTSKADLPPRLSGPNGPLDRGWQVEIEAGGVAIFREAGPGDFAAVYGHIQPDSSHPLHVAIPLAERLTSWLADLPAGASRRSGLLQLASGADPSTLRWRIPGSPQNSAWQPLE